MKTIRGYATGLKSQIEEEAEMELDGKDAVLQWLVRWAAMLPSRLLKGKDGRTAVQRRRGRRCEIPAEKMAEKGWYKELKSQSGVRDKFERRTMAGARAQFQRNCFRYQRRRSTCLGY